MKKQLGKNNIPKVTLEDIQLELAKKDCHYFIENFVYIEDRDSPELAIKFTLWPKQAAALAKILINRLLILLKARQLGITWLVLAFATWKMLFNIGFAVVALSKREDDAKELARRVKFILRYLPAWMIQEKAKAPKGWTGPTWEATTLTVTIYKPDGEPSVFTSMSSGPDSGRSLTATLVILDEWAFQQWASDIWDAAYPTINRPTGGQVIGLSTMKRATLFESIWKAAVQGLNSFTHIFLPWNTDPRRTKEWYEQTKKDLPQSYMQEYPATAEEALSAGEGTSFPEFSREIHVCSTFKPPMHWKRWRANDPGYTDPFSFYWLTVDEDGIVYIYREYTRDYSDPKITYSDQARAVIDYSTYLVLDNGKEKEMQEAIGYTTTGQDAWNSHPLAQTGKTIIDFYREGGLTGCIKAITDRKLRKATWHEYLKPVYSERLGKEIARVQIMDCCKKLIETLPELINDEKDPEKVADGPIDHWYDGCLTKDTIVNTLDGDYFIKDLIGTTGMVHCYDIENKKSDIKQFYDVRKTRSNVDVYEIELEDGRTIKATGDHLILTQRGWVEVLNLNATDEIIDIGCG